MKVSLSWLKDFVEIGYSIEELSSRLTMSGFEVESVERPAGDVSRLVVARVASVRPHPNADKLKVCIVETGREKVEVVCGAPNVAEGQLTIFAPPGTMLPIGRKIESAAIRGVMSLGMLCSLAELGLDDESEGIHVFESGKVGEPAAPLLGLDDTALDLNVTPNRPDALSIIGVAREIAAFSGRPLKKPAVSIKESARTIDELAKVEVLDKGGCPRYVARVIEGIKISQSPAWMRARLKTCGMRPINNVVDITNYVMLETGQPLHAFDLNALADKKIIVRRSKDGEKFVTLDESERAMTSADLMICDGKGSVAVAGVMGGLHSEVTDTTTDVLLESACFNPGSIRATSKRLGLFTEASYRFERGVDPDLQLRACNRAIALMAEYAGGQVASGAIDVKADIPAPKPVTLRDKRVNLFLGVELPRKETKALLESIEIEAKETPDGLLIQPPTFRADLKEEADVIEEVARRYGYERIPETLPLGRVAPVTTSKTDRLLSIVRESLTGAGFFEAVTLSFMSPDAPSWLRLPDADRRRRTVKLLNPLSVPEGALRTSLLPGLFNAIAYNLNRYQSDPKLFEVGSVFISGGEGELPEQPIELAGAFAPTSRKSLYATGAHPFYAFKGAIEELLQSLRIVADWKPSEDAPYLMPGETAAIYSGKKTIGLAGRVRPSVAKRFDVDSPLYAFELDFSTLLDLFSEGVKFEKLSAHPPAFRDIAALVADELPVSEMRSAILAVDERVAEASLFDVYRGKPTPEGKKSVAFSITYRFKDKSPLDEEVNEIHKRVSETLKSKFGAEIR